MSKLKQFISKYDEESPDPTVSHDAAVLTIHQSMEEFSAEVDACEKAERVIDGLESIESVMTSTDNDKVTPEIATMASVSLESLLSIENLSVEDFGLESYTDGDPVGWNEVSTEKLRDKIFDAMDALRGGFGEVTKKNINKVDKMMGVLEKGSKDTSAVLKKHSGDLDGKDFSFGLFSGVFVRNNKPVQNLPKELEKDNEVLSAWSEYYNKHVPAYLKSVADVFDVDLEKEEDFEKFVKNIKSIDPISKTVKKTQIGSGVLLNNASIEISREKPVKTNHLNGDFLNRRVYRMYMKPGSDKINVTKKSDPKITADKMDKIRKKKKKIKKEVKKKTSGVIPKYFCRRSG